MCCEKTTLDLTYKQIENTIMTVAIRHPKCRSCNSPLMPLWNHNTDWRCYKCGLEQDPKKDQKQVDTTWK